MRSFEEYHPLAQFLYLLLVSTLAACFVHPYVTALSLLGAVALWLLRNGGRQMRTHLYYLLLLLVITLINPVFRHNGATVLFVLNHNPVTLESLLYGACSGAMLVSVLYWFRTFSQIMSADRLLYLFSKLSPRLGLIVSMALRYVPLFARQAARVHTMQKMLTGKDEDTLIDRGRSATGTVSVMTTWALERGVITADSMTARGYGVGRRTDYHLFRMRRGDIFLMLVTVLLAVVVIAGGACGRLTLKWYPTIPTPQHDVLAILSYIAYAALTLMPCVLEIGGKLRWKFLHSKI